MASASSVVSSSSTPTSESSSSTSSSSRGTSSASTSKTAVAGADSSLSSSSSSSSGPGVSASSTTTTRKSPMDQSSSVTTPSVAAVSNTCLVSSAVSYSDKMTTSNNHGAVIKSSSSSSPETKNLSKSGKKSSASTSSIQKDNNNHINSNNTGGSCMNTSAGGKDAGKNHIHQSSSHHQQQQQQQHSSSHNHNRTNRQIDPNVWPTLNESIGSSPSSPSESTHGSRSNSMTPHDPQPKTSLTATTTTKSSKHEAQSTTKTIVINDPMDESISNNNCNKTPTVGSLADDSNKRLMTGSVDGPKRDKIVDGDKSKTAPDDHNSIQKTNSSSNSNNNPNVNQNNIKTSKTPSKINANIMSGVSSSSPDVLMPTPPDHKSKLTDGSSSIASSSDAGSILSSPSGKSFKSGAKNKKGGGKVWKPLQVDIRTKSHHHQDKTGGSNSSLDQVQKRRRERDRVTPGRESRGAMVSTVGTKGSVSSSSSVDHSSTPDAHGGKGTSGQPSSGAKRNYASSEPGGRGSQLTSPVVPASSNPATPAGGKYQPPFVRRESGGTGSRRVRSHHNHHRNNNSSDTHRNLESPQSEKMMSYDKKPDPHDHQSNRWRERDTHSSHASNSTRDPTPDGMNFIHRSVSGSNTPNGIISTSSGLNPMDDVPGKILFYVDPCPIDDPNITPPALKTPVPTLISPVVMNPSIVTGVTAVVSNASPVIPFTLNPNPNLISTTVPPNVTVANNAIPFYPPPVLMSSVSGHHKFAPPPADPISSPLSESESSSSVDVMNNHHKIHRSSSVSTPKVYGVISGNHNTGHHGHQHHSGHHGVMGPPVGIPTLIPVMNPSHHVMIQTPTGLTPAQIISSSHHPVMNSDGVAKSGGPLSPLIQHMHHLDPNQLMERIQNQIEYYFSDENLNKDIFIRRNMDASTGFCPLILISSFHRVKSLTQDINMIIQALGNSTVIEFSPDKSGIRRRDDPLKWPIVTPKPLGSPASASLNATSVDHLDHTSLSSPTSPSTVRSSGQSLNSPNINEQEEVNPHHQQNMPSSDTSIKYSNNNSILMNNHTSTDADDDDHQGRDDLKSEKPLSKSSLVIDASSHSNASVMTNGNVDSDANNSDVVSTGHHDGASSSSLDHPKSKSLSSPKLASLNSSEVTSTNSNSGQLHPDVPSFIPGKPYKSATGSNLN